MEKKSKDQLPSHELLITKIYQSWSVRNSAVEERTLKKTKKERYWRELENRRACITTLKSCSTSTVLQHKFLEGVQADCWEFRGRWIREQVHYTLNSFQRFQALERTNHFMKKQNTSLWLINTCEQHVSHWHCQHWAQPNNKHCWFCFPVALNPISRSIIPTFLTWLLEVSTIMNPSPPWHIEGWRL